MTTQATRLMMIEVNRNIAKMATKSVAGSSEWQFFCECGSPNCEAHVNLTVAEYLAHHTADQAILAAGHLVDQKKAVAGPARQRAATFLTPPLEGRAEIRCYVRDPDGHSLKSAD